MERCRKLLSIVFVSLLAFANTACACANAADSVADSNPHAHHQLGDSAANADNPLCPHEECEDCASLDIAATPERDASLASFSKLGLDDDVVWIEATALDIHQPLALLASAGPLIQMPLRRADTPVRRADLLLE